MRLTRCAPAFGLAAVSAAAGVAKGRLVDDLATLDRRGGCCRHAARIATPSYLAEPPYRYRVVGNVARVALRHPACPPSVMRLATSHSKTEAATGVSGWLGRESDETPRCPLHLLRSSAAATVLTIDRVRSALNRSCPAGVLVQAAGDSNWLLRRAAAASLTCPVSAMSRLSQDPEPRVRNVLAQNPSCPRWLLDQVAASADAVP